MLPRLKSPTVTRLWVLTAPLAPLIGTSLPMALCSGRIAIMKMNLITEKLAYAFTLINLILDVQIT